MKSLQLTENITAVEISFFRTILTTVYALLLYFTMFRHESLAVEK